MTDTEATAVVDPLVSIQELTVRFGSIVALDKVSFDIPHEGTYGLIGPNGAGKTTLFNCLSRVVPYQSGDLHMDGKSMGKLSPHAIPGIGMARTFQNLAMFGSMSVIDNILVGAHSRLTSGVFNNALRLPNVHREEESIRAEAEEIAAYLELGSVQDRNVQDLPFGTQKRVELARALIQKPRLLMLDEPAAGLTHSEVDELGDLITDIRSRFNLAVLLVEHHMGLVMKISNRLAVLNFGKLIGEGNPKDVREMPAVIEAYLGAS